MKVCYLSSTLSIHDTRILTKLRESNYVVTLVSYSPLPMPPIISSIKGLHILHYQPKHFKKWQKYLFFAKRNHFRRVLNKLEPDILHSGYVWKDGFLAALSGFHPHLLMPWGSDILLQPDQSVICRKIVQFTLRQADKVYCDAEAVKRKAITLSGISENKVVVFPQLGIDLALFKPDQAKRIQVRRELHLEERKVLIMTRNFEKVYGIEYFIKALKYVVAKEPSVKALLAGTGSLERSLKDLAKRLHVEDHIVFLGFVANDNLSRYLNASDIYVSSSLSDGTPLSLLEAMACGLPVVVSDVESVLEWVEDGINGSVAPRMNARVLADKILMLSGSPSNIDAMRRENLEIAKRNIDINKNLLKLRQTYSGLKTTKSTSGKAYTKQ